MAPYRQTTQDRAEEEALALKIQSMKPSDFCIRPMASVLRKFEPEVVAANIMVILGRTGNMWRKLAWDEYEAERTKDGELSGLYVEKKYFDEVVQYTTDPKSASLFSPAWKEIFDSSGTN